jgi:hypothetical protein
MGRRPAHGIHSTKISDVDRAGIELLLRRKEAPALFGTESAYAANGLKSTGKHRIFEHVAFERLG